MATGTAPGSPSNPAPRGSGKSSATEVVAYDRFIEDQLGKTRRQVKGIDLASSMITLAAGAILYLLAAIVVDQWIFTGGLGFWGRLLCLAGFLGSAIAYCALSLIPLILHRINPVYAAHQIEQSTPSLKNSLVNFLLLRNQTAAMPSVVWNAIEEKAATDLSRVQSDTTIDSSRLIKLGWVLLAVMIVAAGYKVISPKDPIPSIRRVLSPWSSVAAPTRVRIDEIQPGKTQGYFGKSVVISAAIHGVKGDEPVALFYSTADGQVVNQTIPMAIPDGEFRHAAKLPPGPSGLQEDVTYWIVAGDATSPRYDVQVVSAPTIEVESVDYVFPAYTGIESRKAARQGEILALEGTKVTIAAQANNDIRSAWIDFACDGHRSLSMTASGHKASATFTLALKPDPLKPNRSSDLPEHDKYQLGFDNLQGAMNEQPIRYKIQVTPDLPPEIKFTQPDVAPDQEQQLVEGAAMLLALEAADPDFQLAQVTVMAERKGVRFVREKLLAEPRKGQVRPQFVFDSKKYGLKNGDEIVYWAEAQDNKEPNPNVTETPRYKLRIASPPSEKKPQDQLAQNNPPDQKPKNEPPQNQQKNPNDQKQNPQDKNQQDQQDKQEKQPGQQDRREGDQKQGEENKPGENGKPGDKQQGENKPGDKQQGDKQQGDQKNQDQPNGEQKPGEQNKPGENGKPGDKQQGDQKQGESKPAEGQKGEGQEEGGQKGNGQKNGGQNGGDQKQGEQADGGQGEKGGQKGGQKGNDRGVDPSDPGKAIDEINKHIQEKQKEEQQKNGGSQKANGQGDKQDQGKQDQGAQKQPGAKDPGDKNAGGQQQPAQGQKPDQGQKPEQGNQPGQQGEKAGQQGDKGDQQGAKPGQQGDKAGQLGEKGDKAGQQGDKPGQQGDKPGEQGDKQQGQQPGQGEKPQQGANNPLGQKPGEGGNKPDPQAKDPGKDQPKEGDGGQAQGQGKDDKQPKGGDKQDPKAQGGDPQGKDKGDAGAGQGAGDNKSPAPEENNKPKEKTPSPADGGKPNDKDQPESPSGSKNQSDSQGGQAGDQSGGGKKGGGQRSDSPGTGSAGQNTASDQGGGQAAQKGEGETSKEGGDKKPAGKPTDNAKSQGEGPGSKSKPGDKQQGGDPGQKPDGQQQPGQSNQQSDNKGGGTSTGNPQGGGPSDNITSPQRQNVPEPGGEDPNLEYTRKATDLAVENLKDQLAKNNLDQELLDKLKWSREDVERFVKHWEDMKREAGQPGTKGKAAQQQLDESLRSLGLRPKGTSVRSKATADKIRDLKDARDSQPPAEYADQYRAYSTGTSKAKNK